MDMAKPTKKKPVAKKKSTVTKKAARKTATPKSMTVMAPGIKKEYFKTKDVCKVTFKLPKIAATGAKNVSIVGDFNTWNIYANPMKKLKSGDFTITLELEPGREYQFRYLIDDTRWENDWNADKYVKGPFGSDNSVIYV
jgi:1,4-alpha-glucan branching enzyme